jgi:hypothetical protein
MPIADRNLAAGTQLTATYKKTPYICAVEANEDGSLAYVLEDGRRFSSPSAAASAVMNGSAANGWKWWSLATEVSAKPAKQPKGRKGKVRGNGMLKVLPDQTGVAEGEIRYWCSGCQDGFDLPADQTPTSCPQGHSDPPSS